MDYHDDGRQRRIDEQFPIIGEQMARDRKKVEEDFIEFCRSLADHLIGLPPEQFREAFQQAAAEPTRQAQAACDAILERAAARMRAIAAGRDEPRSH